MTPKSATLWLIGGAIGMVVLEKLSKHKDPGKATVIVLPGDPITPPTGLTPISPSGGAPVQATAQPPMLVQANPIPVAPGQRYRVTLVTHGAASALATDARVISEAQSRGFTNVSASKNKPAGWPGSANGDYYVSATYSGAPKTQARTEGNFLGSVDVAEVWLG